MADAKTQRKLMTISFWAYMKNNGDGSTITKLFATEDEAERAAAGDEERFDDDIEFFQIMVDETGKFIKEL